MKTNQDLLEIVLSGEGIRPDSLKAGEVAEIISAYEHSLLAIITRENPQIDIEEVFISLVDVQENSAHFKFIPRAKEFILAAALTLNTAINTNQIDTLPYRSVESLNKIWVFSKRKNCVTEFTSTGQIPSAKVTPENEIKISESFFYQGETNIYGVVERVGGTTPKVRLKLDDGNIVYLVADLPTVKKLATNLYETIGLKGIAKWRKENLTIEDFVIEDVLFFKDTTNTENFSELKEDIGAYWDKVSNIDEFITSLRYKD
jgi:hypothetical protein